MPPPPLLPNPEDGRLTAQLRVSDQHGSPLEARVIVERPLTLFLNSREIVTMMTIGDYPRYLAVGYLLNQNMLRADDEITAIEHDDDLAVVVVRTARQTDYEGKLARKILTSGCAQGTVFGDLMDKFDSVVLDPQARIRTSSMLRLMKAINTAPSLYLTAGAIHGCVLCEGDAIVAYMEDVGRHNAVDKIAGYMFLNGVSAAGKVFYTTGRLTSEMVIKTVQMRIPILISRSGFTAWGVDLARRANLTLIGRARGSRFITAAGDHRIVYDLAAPPADGEPSWMQRKASRRDACGD